MKLIDLDELLETFVRDADVSVTGRRNAEEVKRVLQTIYDDIKESPVVDAVPVRHGKWIQVGHIEHMQIVYKCSACNGQTIVDGNFCPNCGARMDAERKEE